MLRRRLLTVSAASAVRGLLVGLAAAVLTTSAADPSMDERAAKAAREGLARKKAEIQSQVQIPADDRKRVKTLSDIATRRGDAEIERLRAKQEVPERVDGAGVRDAKPAALAGRVVVALSSSMPEAMLTSYLQQLDPHRESLVVLRGFVGGAHVVRPTGTWMERLLRKVPGDPNGGHYRVETVIDPLFFQQLSIDQVPAVAWLGGVQSLAHCDQEDYSKATVVYGAASVDAALKQARKAGAAVPERVIAQYRGTGWERRP